MESIQKAVSSIETSPLLKCFTQGTWTAACQIGADGVATFHVETLEEALNINAIQALRGWTAGFVPFGLYETVEQAHSACGAMRELQGMFRQAKRRRAAAQQAGPAVPRQSTMAHSERGL